MRPFRKPGVRVPVYQMRRLVNALVGKSEGISIHHNDARQYHRVTIAFASDAEASRFYAALEALDPLVKPLPDYSRTIVTSRTA